MIDEALKDSMEALRLVALRSQSLARLLSSRIGATFAEIDQAKQGPERGHPLRGSQPFEHEVGVLFDREGQTSSRTVAPCLVVREREQARAALAPELEQRLLQERKHAGLAVGIVEQSQHQLRLHVDAQIARRALDHVTQAIATGRSEIDARDPAVAI